MKKGIILTVLGAIGILQYSYFQLFTKLAFNYESEIILEDVGGMQVPMIYVTVTRDWTVGVGGAVIGLILLIWGIRLVTGRRTFWLPLREHS